MTEQSALQRLLTFLAASPTPFHATSTIAERLVAAGYSELDEREVWPSGLSGRHFVRRNASSIIAWRGDSATAAEQGIRMVGAHTDSPCLKVKPNATLRRNGYYQLGVEVYGGALLNPWFDRDLSLAGRVSYQVGSESRSALIDFRCPIAVIPSLAIHLDREANKNREVNPQQHLPVLLSMDASESRDFDDLMLEQLLREHPECGAERVLAAELSFYDTQAPAVIGIQGEFVASARLDNLLSCFAGLEALCNSESSSPAMLVCNDHEEIGSTSAAGADGPMLLSLLTRLLPDPDVRERALSRSMMISSDNAHAIHPNYADKHDGNHGPLINGGPVIKVNANQRYATNSETAAAFRLWCDQEVVPVQTFVTRSDLGCGSTIGPITSAKTGVRTLDVGLPTFAMHSIRELAGSQDLDGFCRVLTRFYDSPLP